MRSLLGLLLVIAAILAVLSAASCNGSDPNVARLEFSSNDIADGELALAKDGSVLVGVLARDPHGDEVEISADDLEWTSSDPQIVEVRGLGTAALITGLRDWFDTLAPPCPAPDAGAPDGGAGGGGGCPEGGSDAGTEDAGDGGAGGDAGAGGDGGTGGDATADGGAPTPYEPSAELTVSYRGEIAATIRVSVVLSAAGRWRAVIDGTKMQEMTLEQDGRRVAYSGTTGDASGFVRGDQFTLMQLGFSLEGAFVSRTEVRGTYTAAGGSTGTFVATKQP